MAAPGRARPRHSAAAPRPGIPRNGTSGGMSMAGTGIATVFTTIFPGAAAMDLVAKDSIDLAGSQ
jgi:hypothetical protein